MADQLPTHAEDDVRWAKATSKNGKSYQTGTKETAPVIWPVGDMTWKTPSKTIQEVGIWRYRLFKNTPSHFYRYTLEISNSKGWGFWFYDQSEDSYYLRTWVNGNHVVQYNSDQPGIVAVRRDDK